MWHLNLDPMRRYSFRSNSSKFRINAAKRKFTYLPTYLPAVHICDLVSNQGSPVAAYSGKFIYLPTRRAYLRSGLEPKIAGSSV
jgi:hypothetical protein